VEQMRYQIQVVAVAVPEEVIKALQQAAQAAQVLS